MNKPYDECSLVCYSDEQVVWKCPWFYVICQYDRNGKEWACARFDERSALETSICFETTQRE